VCSGFLLQDSEYTGSARGTGDEEGVATDLEVVSKRPVSEHLEESVVVGVLSNVVKIYGTHCQLEGTAARGTD
jgi:hypothetical protein